LAVATIERAFGRRLADIFATFEEAPLAAASIAQVHAATLKSGEEVVVKILRPGMHEVIERDLEVLGTLAMRSRTSTGRMRGGCGRSSW
jgi:ubiquinone biosynthesis protein